MEVYLSISPKALNKIKKKVCFVHPVLVDYVTQGLT